MNIASLIESEANVQIVVTLSDLKEFALAVASEVMAAKEAEKFVTDQAFDLRISVNKELREATENEVELFNKHYAIWKKEKEAKEHRAFKPFDKVLVRSGDNYKWLPALFIRDRGVGFESRHTALPIHSGEPASFAQCISYDGNEYLAFTSDPF